MKQVLFSLFFLFGLAIVQLQAQSCQPCPPACCAQPCKRTAAADKKACTPEAAAKCTPAQLESCKGSGKFDYTGKKWAKSAAANPKSKSPAVQTVSVQPADRKQPAEGEM